MPRLHKLSLPFITLLAAVLADKEHADHTLHPPPVHQEHFKDGVHNPEFDHEAILGSVQANHEFENLPPHESKRRLRLILDKMDTDHDDIISRKEIVDWVVHSFVTLNEEEAGEKIKDYDQNNDGWLTWKEYLEVTYRYSPDQLKELEEDTNPEIKHFLEMVKDDEDKFKLADEDGNKGLSISEFSAFLHPYNHMHMHQMEIDRAMKHHDKNGDGSIDFQEYLGEAQPDEEQLIVDKEQFDYYDTNQDGKLDGDEIKQWVLPDDHSLAEDEAEHLYNESDVNGDGVLSREEVVEKYDVWVGSAATNYGQHLHDPQEL